MMTEDGAPCSTNQPHIDRAAERYRASGFAVAIQFHAVGMVADDDKKPKASIAILVRALGEAEPSDAAPTVGKQSAEALGNEIQTLAYWNPQWRGRAPLLDKLAASVDDIHHSGRVARTRSLPTMRPFPHVPIVA
jgi:hypothetical protein